MVTIFIESISNQNNDKHPVWQKILDLERYERKKDGFVTVFPFHSFLFGIIYIKIWFLVQIEKTPQRFLKLFFKLMVNLLPFYFFVSNIFSTFANVILNTIFLP